MKLSSKTPVSQLSYDDFLGGINLSVPPDSLGANELQVAENLEYDPNNSLLQVVGGVRLLQETGYNIESLSFHEYTSFFLFSSGGKLYKTDLTTVTEIGALTGAKRPSYLSYDDNLSLIASGGKLQAYNGTELTTVESPDCDIVFERASRIVIANTGSDTLTYSAVGDYTSWTHNTNDPSSAQSVDVGFKDGGDIVAIVPLMSDIVVFKNNNKVFRIVNEYPNWVVQEVTRTANCINASSALQIANDVLFLGSDGLRALSSVIEYGDIKVSEIGDKVNPAFINNVASDARLVYVPNKKQVWVKPNNNDTIYLFHYSLPQRPFTTRSLAFSEAVVIDNQIYISRGSKILKMDDSISTDEGVEIVSRMKSRRFTPHNHYLIKRITVNLQAKINGNAELFIGKSYINFNYAFPSEPVYNNTKKAYGNTKIVYAQSMISIRKRVSAREKTFWIFLTTKKGGFGLRSIILDYSEV